MAVHILISETCSCTDVCGQPHERPVCGLASHPAKVASSSERWLVPAAREVATCKTCITLYEKKFNSNKN